MLSPRGCLVAPNQCQLQRRPRLRSPVLKWPRVKLVVESRAKQLGLTKMTWMGLVSAL